jgi:rRNA biogenesis protein RRP5
LYPSHFEETIQGSTCTSDKNISYNMAPIKRKSGPTNDSFTRSRKAADNQDRPVKRPRQEDDAKDAKHDKPSTGAPLATKLAREEEVAFPRGGASVLTPLEYKQINIDATRDVLFEQQSGDAEGAADGKAGAAAKAASKKRKSKTAGPKDQSADAADVGAKIEGLSYKRLLPGSLVLGQVSQINPHDIALALPNNLTGYIPLTSISEKLTQKVEKMVADDAEGVESDSDEEEDDIELKTMFTVGQYLRAYVVSTSDTNSDKPTETGKRRIELSIEPRQANVGITAKELVSNVWIMASVTSVEDHGLIMDIGMEKAGIRGFMSSKETGTSHSTTEVQEGMTMLCMITGLSSNGKVVKLSADHQKLATGKGLKYISEAPTVDAFLPGTAVEMLVTDMTVRGVAGKLMGMVDTTADLIHSGLAGSTKDLTGRFKIGSKVKARIISTFPGSEPRKLGVSLLDHVLGLTSQTVLSNNQKRNPLDLLGLSAVVETVTVKRVQPGVGLFVDVGLKGVSGFVHISRVSDGKVESLSEETGPFKLGSTHRGRVVGFNPVDGMYLVSLEKKILDQPFLRIEDVAIGSVVHGKVEKLLVNANGFGGLLVNLADGITGLVPEMHLADVSLLHPEKKFKEGMKVTARVLSTDPSKRQIRLTLKKTLVNSESPVFKSYDDIEVGMQSPGTIVNIVQGGAVVQFYGNVRGFLPVSEMSEAYIQDPTQHFRKGQVVNVHVLQVDPEAEKLQVSCKDPSVFGMAQQNAYKKLRIGDIVSGTVTEKSNNDVSLELTGGLRAVLPVNQLSDGSETKSTSVFKKIRVGQTMSDLVVLSKFEPKHLLTLTNKPALVEAARSRTLVRDFDDIKEGKVIFGFVKNITATAVFVQFGGGVTGLLPKAKLSDKAHNLPDFGLKLFQSISVKVISVDAEQGRFLLSAKDAAPSKQRDVVSEDATDGTTNPAVNPIDENITNVEDFVVGKVVKARIASVKETQINVQLADNVQGRIDVSEAFQSWDDIKDRKHPLKSFTPKQVVSVRVLGMHDAKNHRFLPISHRAGKTPVFELSIKSAAAETDEVKSLSLSEVEVGSSWIAFVNNVGDDCLWVNLTPNIRGRIRALDISDDLAHLNDLDSNYPVGSAIKVQVKSVDATNNRLDLVGRSAQGAATIISFDTLKKDVVLPGKVTKVSDRQIMVQLNESISAPVNLTDLADDFSEANPTTYSKNDVVRVSVVDIDAPNKRLRLSTRPSRVLNSSLPVKDKEVISISDLKVNNVVRGFVKHVADNGVFVSLGGDVTAYVRVSDLSDSYLKDWKTNFEVGQLVKGKVIVADAAQKQLQLSLKSSVIDKDYVAPLTLADLQAGQIVTGKIRKVEDFGVFIVVDKSQNVSGLCHRSEIADDRVTDVKKLYSEGDLVKAKVLKVELEKKRVSFGLKASYFQDDVDSEEDSDDEMAGVELTGKDAEMDSDSEAEAPVDAEMEDVDGESSDDDEDEDTETKAGASLIGTGGFDWNAETLDAVDDSDNAESGDEEDKDASKKKKRKPTIKVDRTGDLDAHGPQSTSDFERLLLGQPNASELWIAYMAFQMKLNELSKAREVAERAIRTINIREETEKLNVWIALLNLENAYGSDETTEEVFKRACQYNDALEVHERLTSIYIQSGKHSVSLICEPSHSITVTDKHHRKQTISSNPWSRSSPSPPLSGTTTRTSSPPPSAPPTAPASSSPVPSSPSPHTPTSPRP